MLSKKKILFFLYLPVNPVEDTSAVSSLLHSSLLLETFDCTFFDLSEKIGRWKLLKRIKTVVDEEQPDLCYFIPFTLNGIKLRDYEVKMLLNRMKVRFQIYYTGGLLNTLMSRLLKKAFFCNQNIIITDWRDYLIINQYTPKQKILICPVVDGNDITLKQFENKMIDILKQQL